MDSALQRKVQAKETLDTVQALSDILDTGLDRTSLDLLLQLLEAGCNPEVMWTRSACGWRAFIMWALLSRMHFT